MSSTPPASQHTVDTSHGPIRFELVRRARRTIGLRIDQRGLTIAAPNRAALRDIVQLVQRKADWIKHHLQSRPVPEPLRLDQGTPVSLLGEELVLQLHPGTAHITRQQHVLRVRTPDPGDTHRVRQQLVRWLRTQARPIFAERLAHYARQLGRPLPELALSSARTRWGSCNHRGAVRLNWRLIQAPLPLLDYVVAHELAHGLEMNHSPRFWAVVASIYPDWKQARQQLNQLAPALYRLDTDPSPHTPAED